MPTISREDIDSLNAVLTVHIKHNDYEGQVKQALSKLKKQVNVKGFRAGKTPVSYIKKMYGEQVLAEEINKILQDQISTYIKENELNILGNPIPKKQENLAFNINLPSEYDFQFELGFEPDFSLKGMSKKTVVSKYKVALDKKVVDQEIDNYRRQFGEQSSPTKDLEEKDILSLSVKELKDGKVKRGGLKREFKIGIEFITDKKVKKEVLKLKKGGKFDFNIFKFQDRTEEYVRKYILGIDEKEEVGQDFRATIDEVSRFVLAPIDQELFDKLYGPGVISTEKEMRERINENMSKYFNDQVGLVLQRDIRDTILEKNNFDLPNDFLKRWLMMTNENVTQEQLDLEYDDIAKGLRWNLIEKRLAEKNEVKVTEEEIIEKLKEQIAGYFGGSDMGGNEEMLNGMVERMKQDKDTMDKQANRIYAEKVLEIVEKKVKIEDKEISAKEFEELLK